MHRDAIQSLCISLRPNEFGLNLTFSRVLYLLFPQPSIYSLSLSLSLRTVFLQLREWSISWPRQPPTQGSIPSCSAGSPLGSGRRVFRCCRLETRNTALQGKEEEKRQRRLCHHRHHHLPDSPFQAALRLSVARRTHGLRIR